MVSRSVAARANRSPMVTANVSGWLSAEVADRPVDGAVEDRGHVAIELRLHRRQVAHGELVPREAALKQHPFR
jgi:hypothetical protein